MPDSPTTADLTGLLVEPARFWFVWTKKGRAPKFAHNTFDSAVAESARLAWLYPGRKFIVLEGALKISAPAPAAIVVAPIMESAA